MTYYSKGMLQKVNLMQATLRIPDLLLLDEPLSGLDVESVDHLTTVLKQLTHQGTAIVAAVHESDLGRQLGGLVYWLRQGQLVQADVEEVRDQEMFYELDCELHSDAHRALTVRFADVGWSKRQGGFRYRIPARIHREFLVLLLQNDGTIRTLMRKE